MNKKNVRRTKDGKLVFSNDRNHNQLKSKNNRRRKKRKRSKKKFSLFIRVLLIFSFILLLGISVALGAFYSTINKMNNVKLDPDNLGIVNKEELSQYDNYKKVKNIALFGVDSVDGVGRSDAIMIATVDPIHDKLKISSIMRDSYVNIDGHGNDKLNHAYAFGGPELAIKTINQTFGLNIDDFVSVDFNSLPKIIDTLGGMELDITSEELKYINAYINSINSNNNTNSPHITKVGKQKVDGTQALAYSRIRYTAGGDYERTHRQRIVLDNLFNIALSTPVSSFPSIIKDILPLVNTSLTAKDILSLGTKVITMGNGTLEQERFPKDEYSSNETINSIYYLVFDRDATKQQMMDYIFDDK